MHKDGHWICSKNVRDENESESVVLVDATSSGVRCVRCTGAPCSQEDVAVFTVTNVLRRRSTAWAKAMHDLDSAYF